MPLMPNAAKPGPTPGYKRSALDLSTLLGYYLACVEEEDRRSLQLRTEILDWLKDL